jgi:deazaflavin-dependent oxidoreductase (nitroreductase family)
VIDRLQKSLINPLDKLAFALRIPPPGDALFETTGRHTGRPRVTPVCHGSQADTFWIVAQQGRSADYVRNLEANPRVHVKGSLTRGGWRTGTAHILDDDDPEERVRILSRGNRWRRLCLQASTKVGTSLLTVRIDLDPVKDRQCGRAETILMAIERCPGVEVDVDEIHGSAGVRVGIRLVARSIYGVATF